MVLTPCCLNSALGITYHHGKMDSRKECIRVSGNEATVQIDLNRRATKPYTIAAGIWQEHQLVVFYSPMLQHIPYLKVLHIHSFVHGERGDPDEKRAITTTGENCYRMSSAFYTGCNYPLWICSQPTDKWPRTRCHHHVSRLSGLPFNPVLFSSL
jgi:hypothetical protein